MKKLVFFFAMVFAVGTALAQSNVATINQYGTNIAEIEQAGSANAGIINQGTNVSPVTNSGPNNPGNWLYGAFIDQIGNNNEAKITMNSSSNGASIDQKGNFNKAEQELNAPISKTTSWDRMGLDIDQIGSYNNAAQKTVGSFGCYGVQGMMIKQEGDYNIANQLSVGGMSNVTEITQIGNNNNNPTKSGNVYDVSATTLADPLSLPFAHRPTGDYTQYTNQMLGTTHIYVEGDNNNTYQHQEYRVWSTSGRNNAWIDIYGSNNDVAQGQLGESNSSDIDILGGNNNVITSSQYGDNNFVKISLALGSDNCIVGVEQVGNSHSATVSQNGDFNFAKVVQHF